MIHPHSALLRHAQDFFRSDLLGLYSWDRVQITSPELAPPIAAEASLRDRRAARDRREGRYLGQARLIFGNWEILIYSPNERPPLGEVVLRPNEIGGAVLVSGPIDAATWAEIGQKIRKEAKMRFLG